MASKIYSVWGNPFSCNSFASVPTCTYCMFLPPKNQTLFTFKEFKTFLNWEHKTNFLLKGLFNKYFSALKISSVRPRFLWIRDFNETDLIAKVFLRNMCIEHCTIVHLSDLSSSVQFNCLLGFKKKFLKLCQCPCTHHYAIPKHVQIYTHYYTLTIKQQVNDISRVRLLLDYPPRRLWMRRLALVGEALK